MTGSPSSPFFPSKSLPGLRRRIVSWFAANGRDLPWRNQTDPYVVWVSEIMLQQTTTETVIGYFGRFMKRFPTVDALARADLAEVLHYWEGLGYYRRAHQLRRTAEIVSNQYGGLFPTTRSDLEKLPGIGRYTVGAVLSFALNRREPILEANTTRLHARILALSGDVAARETSAILWDFAERILPVQAPGRFNQALIDLGRIVCLPRHPRCGGCPCVRDCRAAQTGRQAEIPTPKAKRAKEDRTEVAYLIRRSFFSRQKKDERRFLFVRYPENVRWGGLWDFPRFLQEGDEPVQNDIRLLQKLRSFLGAKTVEVGPILKEIRHAVTRYRIRLVLCAVEGQCDSDDSPFYLSGVKKGKNRTESDANKKSDASKKKNAEKKSVPFSGGTVSVADLTFRWLTLAEAAAIPLSSTGRKLVDDLQNR